MNPYHFHSTVVLRHPVYSFQQFNENQLAAKLQDSFFRDAIYLCSQTVFNELKKYDFEYARLSPKLKHTLFKYFNRMCYRPTPFALCSAVSTVSWFADSSNIRVNLTDIKPQVKLSYAKSLLVAADVLQASERYLLVKANDTLYKTGSQLRYLKSIPEDADKISFYIATAEVTSLLTKILSFTAVRRSTEEVVTLVIQKTNCTTTDATEYMQLLLEEQILVDADAPNITGPDYVSRLNSFQGLSSFISQHRLHEDLKEVKGITGLNNYLSRHSTQLQKNDLYVNLESSVESGSITSEHQKVILDGLQCLALFNQPHVPKGIHEFVQQFNKKFEGQTIPLLLALDPEAGVGYIGLTAGNEELNFAEGIAWGKEQANVDALKWGRWQSLLLQKWMSGGKYKPIKLTAGDVNVNTQEEPIKWPSSLSVMFRPAGDKVFIEQISGVTATSLIGRFTPVSTKIDALAHDMAAYEAEANPGVIYAEIVHTCHKQTANIDRRNHIYPYEIVMLTPSTIDEQYQIPLSELYVSVLNNEVVLWSAKHEKRVIPRLSSAFNYQRDDLAAFRFLCDLQHVGVQTNFNFAVENYYSGLDFYPRVEFEQAILQCAQWHLDVSLLLPIIKEQDVQRRLDGFKQFKGQIQLSKYIALTQHDHQLVFNLDSPADIDFFLETVKPLKKAVVKEVLTDTIHNPVLFNENQEGIASQFIASLYHKQVVYQPQYLDLPLLKKQPVRKFLPGSEWLYFKLYAHPARTNEIIGAIIYPAIKQVSKDNLITQWFFTRYNDPDHHIRVRLKVRSGKHQDILELFNKLTSDYLKQGLLNNVIIDTYRRELERYPDIDDFESISCHSSNRVSSYLNRNWQNLTQDNCLSFAFLTTRNLLGAAGFSGDEKMSYIKNVVDAFLAEFSHVPDLKYQLDLTYRKYRPILIQLDKEQTFSMPNKISDVNEGYSKSLSAYYHHIHTLPLKTKFKQLSDIIHMHLNRVFADRPREQEFTLYYMLLKHEKSSKYLNQAV